MADDDESVYTIEADIAEDKNGDACLSSYRNYAMSSDDRYLTSYRAYTGPQDGFNGVPLGSLHSSKYVSDTSTVASDSGFIQYRPSSHTLLSVFSAIFCFCPVGLAALVYSCRAQKAKRDGKFSRAGILSKNARVLALASIGIGIVLFLVALFLLLMEFVPEFKNRHN
ncbi:Synapse differentiation-inducing protein 1 [Bulinus truncatus]|nr:Synapse differentiation-inducing protein 1 [Bulinus truncatus]